MASGFPKMKLFPTFMATEDQKIRSHLGNLDDYLRLYKKSLEDPDAFWGEVAEQFYWKTFLPKKNILNYNIDANKGRIFTECFKGGSTNICYNALDRNVQNGFGETIAYYWEGNNSQDSGKITYNELLRLVCRFANVLKSKGVKKGDMVAMYMPMIPELAVTMFACARIGAIHSVVYGGYSSEALSERLLDGNIQILIAADAGSRGKKFIPFKSIVDSAVEICGKRNHHLHTIIVLGHHRNLFSTKETFSQKKNFQNSSLPWDPTRNVWWHEEMAKADDVCDVEWVDAEHTLFTLYTSGSTGKPKGAVHATGGYMIYAAVTFKYTFDYNPGDVFFCTADIGWITGHTFNVYGSLLNAATCVLFSGIPTHPDPSRYWEIVERFRVTHFYTSPTAIRSLMRHDDTYVIKTDRTSLRVLATVGEPINSEAWMWFYSKVGEERCPIVNTYWQTETGGPILTPIPFCTPMIPGSAGLPFFGVEPVIVDDDGNEIIGAGKGNLVIKRPWPSIMRTIHEDHTRYETAYFKKFPGYYFTGDGAIKDECGFFWVTGRVDDMLNVCGRLLSTAEVESALMNHKKVAESAVVALPHPLKGECLYCFVVLKNEYKFDERIIVELTQQVEKRIGAFARPEYFHQAEVLPKTRSGKTVRRILRKIAANDRDFGDVSTLLDETVINNLFNSEKYLNSSVPVRV